MLFGFIVGFIAGLAVGWTFAQPQWAKDLWAKIKSKVTG